MSPYYATISPAGSLSNVKPGVAKVTAIDFDGDERYGFLRVEVGGCSDEGSCITPGTTDAGNESIAAQVQLGRCAFGMRVGALSIYEKYPTNLLCTPACLGFLYPSGPSAECELITNSAGIRQVYAPEGLANVVVSNSYKYFIEIYSPSVVSTNKDTNGLYTFSGGPLAIITVENPDATGATTNKLCITDGDGAVSNYEWKTNGWELLQGGGLRSEYKTTVISNDFRTTTVEVRGTNGLASCQIRKYQNFSFGEKLLEQVNGTGATALTNYFEYYTNLSLSTTGLLKQATYANGAWEIHAYETNRLRTNSAYAFLNQGPTTSPSLIRMIEYRYGSNAAPGALDKGKRRPAEPRRVSEYIQGHEVSRRYKLYYPFEKREIRCVNPGAAWNDPSNLVTVTKWFSDTPNTNRLKSIERPDGTMEIYQYGFFTNASGERFRTNIVLTGVPDSYKTNIVDGTKSITVLGRVGQMASRTVIDIVSGITTVLETYSDYDEFNRPRKITYLDATFTWTDYGCCGPITTTNREGTLVTHLRDPLKRPVATKKIGITQTNVVQNQF